MKIPGWAYMAIGAFVSAFSGYVYKFIPRPDGSPNMAMVFFFFIGIIFILIGFVKLFFRKMDSEQEANYERARENLKEASKEPTLKDYHRNKVEEQINKAYSQQGTHTKHPADQGHTSQYAKNHPYHGTPQAGQHSAQASHMQVAVCKKCGNKNPPTSNYCHGCGNRMR